MSADVGRLAGQPVIVGGGVAGMMTALSLAPEPVVLVTKALLGAEASSAWAQGGLAASLGEDDTPALHLADTLAAGDGFCDAGIAHRIVTAAQGAILALERHGVNFDKRSDGRLVLGLEAAHSRRRIVHATGDGTGHELVRALSAAVRATPSITVLEGIEARRLLVEDNAITGVLATGASRDATETLVLASGRVVLATGGIGGLFSDTTNPSGCFGQGLALAARAGAAFRDLEFIQFHPTALDGPTRPMPLISEAVRGEGAVLIDETGRRFLADLPGAELGPRDMVARAVWHHLQAGHRVFLDARDRLGAGFATCFPAINASCRAAGIDPARQPVPIRPAVHYHMGGIDVDGAGRSSVAGLWACGEVARTGLHGANRLASNSLIEAVVCAEWVAESIAGEALSCVRPPRSAPLLPSASDPSAVRPIMARGLGVLRNEPGLKEAVAGLLPLATAQSAATGPAIVGLMLAMAALRRTESRGAHYRTDFTRHSATPERNRLRFDEAIAMAHELESAPVPLARSAG